MATDDWTARRTPWSAPLYRSRAEATLGEERREVFDSVFQSMCLDEPDADRLAACARLLRHLARTAPRP